MQNIAIGIAAFKDTEAKVFPRWLGYFNFWAALAFLPAALLYFFKTGPFAWDGVFVFWVPLTIFGALVLRHVLRHAQGDPEPGCRGVRGDANREAGGGCSLRRKRG